MQSSSPAPSSEIPELSEAEAGLESPALLSASRGAGAPEQSLARQLLLLALPMLGEQTLIFLVGLVDTYLAGRISATATAAVGSAMYMAWFINLGLALVGTGAAALVSRSVGARDPLTARHATNQGVLMSAIVGIIVAAAAWSAAPWMAQILSQTDEARLLCEHFLRWISASYLLGSVNLVGSAILRSAGDTLTPMWIMLIVNAVNAALSAALVFGWFGPSLGLAGIAIGAVTARSIGGLIMLFLLARGVRGLQLERTLMRPNIDLMRRILRVGLPAAGDTALFATAQFTFISIVAHTAVGAAATAGFAAHVIAMQAEAISYMPAIAWGTAAGTLVGQFLGAKRPDRAGQAGHIAAVQAGLYGLMIGTLFYIFAGTIYGLMSQDAAVQQVGVPAFRLLAFVEPWLCVGIVYLYSLRGAGDTRTTMLMSLFCSLGLRVPVGYLCGIVLHGGLVGAWLGMWADNFTRFVFSTWRFTAGRWKKLRV